MSQYRGTIVIWIVIASAALTGCNEASTSVEKLFGVRAQGIVDSTTVVAVGGVSALAAPIVLTIGQSITIASPVRKRTRTIGLLPTTWYSSNSAVVTASPSGTITGIDNGTAFVLATSGTTTDSLPVVVGTGTSAIAPLRFTTDSMLLRTGDIATAQPIDARYTVTYTSVIPTIATVSTSGVVTAVSVGRTNVHATNTAGASGDFVVVVASSTTTNAPATGRTIAMTLTRFTVGTNAVLVSSGIPLPPGALREADIGTVRVFAGGVEQQIYIEALKGTHPDGSLGAVLVQFPYVLSKTASVSGSVVIGSARTLPLLAKPTADRGLPDAAILPSDPTYLVTTNFVGPTVTVAEATQIPNILASKYDADFGPYADVLWNAVGGGSLWGENYYDRAQAYFAQWIRSGNSKYWYRGIQQALGYRVGYLEDASFGTSPHWSQIDGMGEHYQLTGDEKSRYAVGRVAETMRYFRDRAGIPDHPDIEGRILARTLMAELWGWRLQAMGTDAIATSAELSTLVGRILDRQSTDGAWRFVFNLCPPNAGDFPYMDGMLDEALIQAYTFHQANSRIPTAVQKSSEWIWSQWDVRMQGVKYAPGCPAADYNIGIPELNNLVINSFAWSYAMSGNTTYRQRADSLFNGGIRNQFLYGSKQFNQQYTVSYRYLFWRSAR